MPVDDVDYSTHARGVHKMTNLFGDIIIVPSHLHIRIGAVSPDEQTITEEIVIDYQKENSIVKPRYTNGLVIPKADIIKGTLVEGYQLPLFEW
jgi:hypothetical protein